MNREDAWRIWAPEGARWSAWAKPVLFSFLSERLPDEGAPVDRGWTAVCSSDAAILVELPGGESVLAGLELARFGLRPVPLFNASPWGLDPETVPGAPIVDLSSILRALERSTGALARLHLPDAAPPAFLLDSRRMRGPVFMEPGVFDNRSIVRESDLPSAGQLRAAGVERVVRLRRRRGVSLDLHPILQAWQDGGLRIEFQSYGGDWNPAPDPVRRLSAAGLALRRLLTGLWIPTVGSGPSGRTSHGG